MSISRPGCSFVAAKQPGSSACHRFEYVFPDREIDVFDARPPFTPGRTGASARPALRYAESSVSPATRDALREHRRQRRLVRVTAAVLAYDLRRNRAPAGSAPSRPAPTASRSHTTAAPSSCPKGERSDGRRLVRGRLRRTGEVTHEIHAAPGPHNTIVSPDGKLVYLGPRNSRFLVVASVRTDRVVRARRASEGRRAPVHGRRSVAASPIRPRPAFSASRSRACARGQACSTPSRSASPWHHSLGTPSHGISLTPNGRQPRRHRRPEQLRPRLRRLADVPNSSRRASLRTSA